jgi:hypothetical protein
VEYLALLLLILSLSNQARGDFQGDKELLKQVALQYKANRESIRTWTGKADLTLTQMKTVRGNPVNVRVNCAVTFACDVAAGKSMFLTRRLGGEGPPGGALTPGHDVWGGLTTPEGHFKISAWEGEKDARVGIGPRSRPTLSISPNTSRRRGDFGSEFDPFWYLEDSGMDIHGRLMGQYELWGHKDVAAANNISVSRENDLVTFVIDRPDILMNRYVFDLARGANVIESEGKDSAVHARLTRTYIKSAGVWVPVSSHYSQTQRADGVTDECHVTWVENIINGPVDPGSFTLEALGVKAGDQVNDKRAASSYRYKAGRDMPEVAPIPRSRMNAWIIAGVTIVAILGMAGWWLWRRGKRSVADGQPS